MLLSGVRLPCIRILSVLCNVNAKTKASATMSAVLAPRATVGYPLRVWYNTESGQRLRLNVRYIASNCERQLGDSLKVGSDRDV